MRCFRIAVEWTMLGEYEIEANTIEEATEKALGPDCPLPNDGYYLDDSMIVNEQTTQALNNMVYCALCGKEVKDEDAIYIAYKGDKPRPYCDECEYKR